MTEPLDNLESRLRDATIWSGPSTDLCKRAVATQPQSNIFAFDIGSFARRRWFPLTCSASAACLAFVVFSSSMVRFETLKSHQPVSGERSHGTIAPQENLAGEVAEQTINRGYSRSTLRVSPKAPLATPLVYPNFDGVGETSPGDLWLYGEVTGSIGLDTPISSEQSGGSSPVASTRHVVHKATLELTTPDVRAAFLKAGLILNEALGEHIQDSSLTGTGNEATGTLTLRVVASRLSDVCNSLRELGVVVSERREGQDVTGQVVDLDARLKNERRVEQELLALFDQRKDAPLKDVLDLRQKLSEVRSGIEQMVAQREHLGRLVSLATVLVIIRTGEKPPEEPKDEGLSHYFSESIKHAWRTGTRGLADTVAALVSILIGGLIWWILLIVALLLLRRYVRGRKS